MQISLAKKRIFIGFIALSILVAVIPGINAMVSIINPIQGKLVALTNNSYGVDLSCDDPYHEVPAEQGALTTFMVTITNVGTLSDTYDITADSIEDIICLVNGVNADQFDPYRIMLAPSESVVFEVSAQIWAFVEFPLIGEWPVIVNATSQNDSTVSDELVLTVNIMGPFLFIKSISPSPCVTIENGGNADALNVHWKICVTASGLLISPKPGCTEGTIAVLPAGGEETVCYDDGGFIFGLGFMTTTVTVEADNADAITVTVRWFVLGPFILFGIS